MSWKRRAPIAIGTAVVVCSCAWRPQPAASGSEEPEVGARVTPPCSVEEIDRSPLRLSGRDVYVEPEELHAFDGGILLAGSHTYEWSVDARGRAVSVADRILGVIVRGEAVTPISRPPGIGRIGALRATGIGRGAWAFLFEELADSVGDRRVPVGVRSARLDGSGWSEVRDVPLPQVIDFWFHASSKLVGLGDGTLSWTLPIELEGGPNRVLLFRGDGAAWRSEVIDSSRVEMTEHHDDPRTGSWIGIVGLDEDFSDLRRSLRMYTGSPFVSLPTKLYVSTDGEVVYEPHIASTADGIAVGWMTRGQGGASAWFASRAGGAWTDAALLDADAVQSSLTVLGSGRPVWIVHRAAAGTPPALRIHTRLLDGSVELLESIEHPYTGYFAATAAGPDQIVLVGPEFDPDPTRPTVRSLVLRLSVSCV